MPAKRGFVLLPEEEGFIRFLAKYFCHKQNPGFLWEGEDIAQELRLELFLAYTQKNKNPKNRLLLSKKILRDKYKMMKRKIFSQKYRTEILEKEVEDFSQNSLEEKIDFEKKIQNLPQKDKILLKKIFIQGIPSIAREYKVSVRQIQKRIQKIKKPK